MVIISLVRNISRVPDSALEGDRAEPRDVIRAIADLVSIVEPRLLALWRETEMTFGQRRVLRELRVGPRSAGQVAAALGISAPTLTRQLTKLEDRGLLVRTADTGDRRRVLVVLTASGRKALDDHRVFSGSPLASAARELTPIQRRELVAHLEDLVSLARNRDRDPSGV